MQWKSALFVVALLIVFNRNAGSQTPRCGAPDDCDFSAAGAFMASKASGGPIEVRVIFVDFASNPDTPMSTAMSTTLWSEWIAFMSAQSRGAHEIHVEVVESRDPLDPVWTADYGSEIYGSSVNVAGIARYTAYWSAISPTTTSATQYMGELQAEILLKIQVAYAGLENPFADADLVIFVCLPYGGDNPLETGIGGVQGLAVKKDSFVLLQDVPYDPNDVANRSAPEWRPFGIAMNWWGGGLDIEWATAQILAHEYGHTLGLDHLSGGGADQCGMPSGSRGTNLYYFGPYTLMRPYALEGRSFIPFHEFELWQLGWLHRIYVTANLRSVEITDIRSGGDVYYIGDVNPLYFDLAPGFEARYESGFSIALHGGTNEDSRVVAAGGMMYPSRGLAIWHYLQMQYLAPGSPPEAGIPLDLEVAAGLFADPVTREQPDAVLGYDGIDSWYDRVGACVYRDRASAVSYAGSPQDFFEGPGAEFSYRTNPNSSGFYSAISPADNNPPKYWAQSAVNSIVIRVREDNGSSMIVDILLAPYEDLMAPNGGEILQVGQPYTITWDKEFTIDRPLGIINMVDIYCSRGEGYDDQLIASGVDATLGSYQWTPAAAHVGKTCKIKIVYHNVNDVAHVGEDESDAVFTIVDLPAAKFTDVSNQTGLVPPGVPYSATPGDFQKDEKNDLLITATGGLVSMGRVTLVHSSGTPLFGNATVSNVVDGRGVAVADFDNDGDQDFFLAHETTPKLYRNQSGTFFDVTASIGLASLAAPSTAACWGDYDRDGWLDLYVVRSRPGYSEPPDYLNIAGEGHRLFRNLGATNGGFVDVTDAAGIGGLAGNGSVSASWGDIENDGDLDLIVANLQEPPTGPGGIGNHLFVNQGNGTFVEEFLDRFPGEFYYCTAAQWADINNDGFLDLAVSCAQPGSAIYFNDGSGHFPDAGRVWFDASGNGFNGVQIFDHDLDGWTDVLWVSRSASEPSQFFSGVPAATGVGFVNNTANVGLSASSKAMGAVAADYTRDGDLDLFVGRSSSSGQYFYKTDSRSGANSLGRNYVKVRLDSPLKANNRQGIGATVTVSAGDLVQTRVVDGGSGRGGQHDRDLIFGLGDYAGAVTATVKWPRGHVQPDVPLFVSGPASVDSVNTVVDETMVISNLNAASLIVPGTTFFDWVFSWDTNVACDSSLDVLTFDQVGIQNPCWPGWTTLTSSTPGIVYMYEPKPGGGYLHKFTIYGQDCNLGCSFRYSAFSAMGANQATSATKTKQVKFCPSGF